MLTNVADAINRSKRVVTLNHPNSLDCTVWRKQVLRAEQDPVSGQPTTMGGAPTLGGMGVLRSEDEPDFEYAELGPGKCLLLGVFQARDLLSEGNGVLPDNAQEAQLEPRCDPGAEGWFEVKASDLVLVDMGLGVALAFEVANLPALVHLPPYVNKLVLNPRDDLHALEPFISLGD